MRSCIFSLFLYHDIFYDSVCTVALNKRQADSPRPNARVPKIDTATEALPYYSAGVLYFQVTRLLASDVPQFSALMKCDADLRVVYELGGEYTRRPRLHLALNHRQ